MSTSTSTITEPAAEVRLGLVVPGRRGARTAHGLAGWLLGSTDRSDVALDVVDLGGADRSDAAGRDRDGYVLMVGQYGAVPAPDAEDVVARHAARWADRPVGLVAYGGVSRGRDAASRLRGLLTELDAVVVGTGLGVNTAVLRRDGGPGTFERLAWDLLLDDLAATVDAMSAEPRR